MFSRQYGQHPGDVGNREALLMYYFAKVLQAGGLTVIVIDFFRRFPEVMNRKILAAGIGLFFCGWVIEKVMVRR